MTIEIIWKKDLYDPNKLKLAHIWSSQIIPILIWPQHIDSNKLRILMVMYDLCGKIKWEQTRTLPGTGQTVPTGCEVKPFTWKCLLILVLLSLGIQVMLAIKLNFRTLITLEKNYPILIMNKPSWEAFTFEIFYAYRFMNYAYTMLIKLMIKFNNLFKI